MSVEDFHALDAEGGYVERKERDDVIILHFHFGGAMFLKEAGAAVYCRIAGTRKIEPKK